MITHSNIHNLWLIHILCDTFAYKSIRITMGYVSAYGTARTQITKLSPLTKDSSLNRFVLGITGALISLHLNIQVCVRVLPYFINPDLLYATTQIAVLFSPLHNMDCLCVGFFSGPTPTNERSYPREMHFVAKRATLTLFIPFFLSFCCNSHFVTRFSFSYSL